MAQESVSLTSPLTQKTIEGRIQEIEASRDLDEAIVTKACDFYRQALAQTTTLESHQATLRDYEEIARSGPQRTQQLRELLKTHPKPPSSDDHASKDLDELQALLARKRSELLSGKNDLAQRESAIRALESRPQKIREELTRAKARIQAVESELNTQTPDAAEHPIVFEARTSSLVARRAAQAAEIQALEQEAIIYEPRLALLKAERDLDERLAAESEEFLLALSNLISLKRKEEAEKTHREAELAREAAEEKHPALLAIAQTNEGLSGNQARITDLVSQAERELRDLQSKFTEVEGEFLGSRNKLEKVGLSGVLGEIFLDLRRDLPDPTRRPRRSEQRRTELTTLRVEQIRVEERLRAFGPVDLAVQDAIENADPPISPQEEEEFSTQAQVLLQDQIDLLKTFDSACSRYATALGDVEYLEKQLSELFTQYSKFLDEHLLWTPSTQVFDLACLRQVVSGASWLFATESWKATAESTGNTLANRPALSLSVGLALLSTLLSRRWLSRRLTKFREHVGTKYADGFRFTLAALLYSLAIAGPIPAILLFAGWNLSRQHHHAPFPGAVGSGLLAIGAALFAFRCYSVFSSKDGVAAVHFKWNESGLQVVRRSIHWVTWLGLPPLFVVSMTESFAEDAHRNSIGRLSFVLGMVVFSCFLAAILSPKRGALSKTILANPNSWLGRLRHLWFFAAVLTPIAVAALAGFGYYYTALQLDDRVIFSLLTILLGVIAYHIIVRWLLIARKRLAVTRAREKREAELAAKNEETSRDMPELEISEIDLKTIKKQTQGIFRTAVVMGVMITLIAVWIDVLPALSVFDRELWRVELTGNQEQFRSVTIASVFLALAITIFSFVAAKNLPGLLEISSIHKLPIDAGSRYAISAIGQYLLLATGILIGFRTVGVGWAHVQWLVAALSVGLGFGLQEIFANFVSGLIILLERPVRVGDTVTIGEISGTVSRIRIRATTILDWDQKELLVPNRAFITGQLVNWSLSNPVTRLIARVGIAYGSDTELALRLMLSAARNNSKVLDDPEPTVFFVGFGESSLDFEVRVFVKELQNRGRSQISHEIHMDIDRAFREHDVVIAFPQRDLHIKSGKQLGDESRSL